MDSSIITFSLPSGYTCPGAQKCLAKADPDTGRITDGPKQEFRCFSATNESVFTEVRFSRWKNLQLLVEANTKENMQKLILAAAPRYARAIRVHVAGDFFSQDYFDAWMGAAREIPDTRFYAYTKSLPFWVARLGQIPANFALVASQGGKHDHLITKHDLPQAVVVFHPEAAEALGLEIDKDDSHAMRGVSSALLIHGTQPKGSQASEALRRLKKENISYAYRK